MVAVELSEQAQRQSVWTEVSFPIFICRSLSLKKKSKGVKMVLNYKVQL